MSISMYQASAPVFVRMFGNLSKILDKAEAFTEAKKIDPSVLISARLAPDMFPLSRQVQIATDMAKGCVARLSGAEVPNYLDNESSFSELQARIKKTVEFIQGIKQGQIDGSEDRTVTIKIRGNEMNFKGQQYLMNFVLPNFYFHITTAYDILRHNGVELAKPDFIGGFDQ